MATPFQKKPPSQIVQANDKLNKLLGIGIGIGVSSTKNLPSQKQAMLIKDGNISKELILKSAMFWDSKERIDRIKSLMLTNLGLKRFQDNQSFQVQELASIQLLGLAKNQIVHLQPISVLQTLVCLNINHNKVYDLTPLNTLVNLEELYANHNQITSIDVFQTRRHERLYRIDLYSNKIANLKDLMKAVSCLKALTEFDIQNNPVWNQQAKTMLLNTGIRRLNGQLISKATKQMAKSQTFGTASTGSDLMLLSSSKFYSSKKNNQNNKSAQYPNIKNKTEHQSSDLQQISKKYEELQSQFNNLQNIGQLQSIKKSQKIMRESNIEDSLMLKSCSSFFNQVINTTQLNKRYQDLQSKYQKIDDQFQSQILKNVELKAKVHILLKKKQQAECNKQQLQQKQIELKSLKRKVKQLKQNLFATKNGRKAQLLRTLFQIQTLKPKTNDQSSKPNARKLIEWRRKFQADDVIIIPRKNIQLQSLKLSQQDEQLNTLLNSNSNTIQEMKRQLAYLTEE